MHGVVIPINIFHFDIRFDWLKNQGTAIRDRIQERLKRQRFNSLGYDDELEDDDEEFYDDDSEGSYDEESSKDVFGCQQGLLK